MNRPIPFYDGIPIYPDEGCELGVIFPLDRDRQRIAEGNDTPVHGFEMHPDTMADLKAAVEKEVGQS